LQTIIQKPQITKPIASTISKNTKDPDAKTQKHKQKTTQLNNKPITNNQKKTTARIPINPKLPK